MYTPMKLLCISRAWWRDYRCLDEFVLIKQRCGRVNHVGKQPVLFLWSTYQSEGFLDPGSGMYSGSSSSQLSGFSAVGSGILRGASSSLNYKASHSSCSCEYLTFVHIVKYSKSIKVCKHNTPVGRNDCRWTQKYRSNLKLDGEPVLKQFRHCNSR